MIKILIILIATIFTYNSYSQEFTSAGKEFYFAFPPNLHLSTKENTINDSLYVFIASNVPTKGYIELNNVYGESKTFNFEITNPDEVYIFSQSFWDYEMVSYEFYTGTNRFEDNFEIDGGSHNEIVSQLSWHLVSDEDVSVTILNSAFKTSDATLLFPVTALGKNYIVASYYSDNFKDGDPNTPSQFVIVATEDFTSVEIVPSSPTQKFGMNRQFIELDKGDTYLVQGKEFLIEDLTGTEVISNKNIVVIGSQLRAVVPIQSAVDARDHLLSQNLPTEKWGFTAIVAPFKKVNGNSNTLFDKVRILASENNTLVKLSNGVEFTLDKGKFRDLDSENSSFRVNANKKICVIQYKKNTDSDDNVLSDPFMAIIPPDEQYLNSYKLINLENSYWRNNGFFWERIFDFERHYLNVVILDKFKQSLRINNQIINNVNWVNVQNTEWVYAQIELNAGTNTVSADSTFGVVTYGYGEANSYGYVGGLGLKDIPDTKKEYNISSNINCFEVTGSIVDSLNLNERLNINITEEDNENIKFETTFNQNQSFFNYKASLIDKYKDGKIKIVVNDENGNSAEKLIEIPGFTININESIEVNDIVENIPSKDFYCTTYTMENYGNFVQEILDFEFLGDVDLFSTNLNFPFKLNPGEKIDFQVCFEAEGRTGQHEISVSLVTSCITEERMRQLFIVKPDESDPEISASYDDCDRNIELEISELDDFDFGIKEYRVIDSLNVNVRDKGFNAINLNLDIEVIDPYKDAFISIEVEDSVGFISSFEREIPGHTLSFGEEKLKGVNIDFGNVVKSSKNCVMIPIYNYGMYPITYNNYRLINNYNYSIPLSQFPMTIMPNDSNYLEICMISDDLGQLEIDTLFLTTLCIETPIPMESFIIREILESNSKCDLRLIIKEKTEFEGFGEVFPNPVNDKLNIEIASIYEGDLKYYILDNSGSILDKNTINIGQGLFILEIDVSNLINGNYTIIFEFESNRISRKFIVNK